MMLHLRRNWSAKYGTNTSAMEENGIEFHVEAFFAKTYDIRGNIFIYLTSGVQLSLNVYSKSAESIGYMSATLRGMTVVSCRLGLEFELTALTERYYKRHAQEYRQCSPPQDIVQGVHSLDKAQLQTLEQIVKCTLNTVRQSCGLPPVTGEEFRHTRYEEDYDE